MNANQKSDDLFQFPCDFPIKVLGRRVDDFAQTVLGLVLLHAPDFDPATMEMRVSQAGHYISVTCTIRAVSRRQLDELYRALSGHPAVAMVL